jgi:hypothetical protein
LWHSANIKSTEAFIEKEPEESSIRKEGVVRKRVVAKEITWRDKYITLTDTRLHIRNQSEGEIRDTLELRDITHVRRMVESNHAIAIKGANQDSFRSTGSYGKKMRSLSEQLWGATGMSATSSAPCTNHLVCLNRATVVLLK